MKMKLEETKVSAGVQSNPKILKVKVFSCAGEIDPEEKTTKENRRKSRLDHNYKSKKGLVMEFYNCSICHAYFEEGSDALKHLRTKHSSVSVNCVLDVTTSGGLSNKRRRGRSEKKSPVVNQLIGVRVFRIPFVLLHDVERESCADGPSSDSGVTMTTTNQTTVSTVTEVRKSSSFVPKAIQRRKRKAGHGHCKEAEEDEDTTLERDENKDQPPAPSDWTIASGSAPIKPKRKPGRPKKANAKDGRVEIKLDSLKASEIEALVNDLFTPALKKPTRALSLEPQRSDGVTVKTRCGRTVRRKVADYADSDDDEKGNNFDNFYQVGMRKRKRRRNMDAEYVSTEDDYRCSLCSSCYATLEEYQAHKKQELKRKDYDNANCIKTEPFINGASKPSSRCYTCELTFDFVPDYILHMTTTHMSPEGTYQCPFCPTIFGKLKRFGPHMRRHLIKNKVKVPRSRQKSDCHLCGKVFKYPCELKNHLKVHERREQQGRKMKNNEEGTGEFPCPVCSYQVATAWKLKRHILVHVQPQNHPYQCKYSGCTNRSFTRADKLKQHVDRVHLGFGASGKRLICSYCGKRLKSLTYVKRHHQNYHKGQPLKFSEEAERVDNEDIPWKIIYPKTPKAESVDVQMKKEDNSDEDDIFRVELESVHCEDEMTDVAGVDEELEEEEGKSIIDEKASRSEALFNDPAIQAFIKAYPHLKSDFRQAYFPTSYRKAETSLSCKKCSWTGPYFRLLQNHMREYHNEILPDEPDHGTDKKGDDKHIMCGACGFEAKSLPELNLHTEKDHSVVKRKPFQCTTRDCGMRFAVEEQRNEHIQRVHLTEKQYSCPHCPMKYSSKDHYRRHLKLKHDPNNAEVKVQCKECGRVLLSETHYRKHVKNIHEGASRSKEGRQCKICGQVLATTYNLRNHIKALHSQSTPFLTPTTKPTTGIPDQ